MLYVSKSCNTSGPLDYTFLRLGYDKKRPVNGCLFPQIRNHRFWLIIMWQTWTYKMNAEANPRHRTPHSLRTFAAALHSSCSQLIAQSAGHGWSKGQWTIWNHQPKATKAHVIHNFCDCKTNNLRPKAVRTWWLQLHIQVKPPRFIYQSTNFDTLRTFHYNSIAGAMAITIIFTIIHYTFIFTMTWYITYTIIHTSTIS